MTPLEKTRERELDQHLQRVSKLQEEIRERDKVIKRALAELDKFHRIVWGPEGDCGATRIVEDAMDALSFNPNEDDTPIQFQFPTTLPISVEKVLNAAQGLMDVVVLGWTEDDKEYAASSTSSVAEILLLLERTKIKLLSVDPQDHFETEISR